MDICRTTTPRTASAQTGSPKCFVDLLILQGWFFKTFPCTPKRQVSDAERKSQGRRGLLRCPQSVVRPAALCSLALWFVNAGWLLAFALCLTGFFSFVRLIVHSSLSSVFLSSIFYLFRSVFSHSNCSVLFVIIIRNPCMFPLFGALAGAVEDTTPAHKAAALCIVPSPRHPTAWVVLTA